MSYPVMPLGFLGSQGDQDTYRIERSLRFNSADSAYLNRTPNAGSGRQKFTISFWTKKTKLGNNTAFVESYFNGLNFFLFGVTGADDRVILYDYQGGTDYGYIYSPCYRDVSAWYHFMAVVDTTSATANQRFRLYVNGEEVTAKQSDYGDPPQNHFTDFFNTSFTHSIGRRLDSGTYYDGLMTEFYIIDGQALTPSSFGETDAITGRWKAKAYSGTYGTNGFYLKFADNSGTTDTTLGKDSSGNGNNWTPNNFSVTAGAGNDSLVDSPTNYGTDSGVGGEVRGNYCTLNPLITGNVITPSNGNLESSLASGSNAYFNNVGTTAITSGKWYWECSITARDSSAAQWLQFGIVATTTTYTSNALGYSGNMSNAYAYYNDGSKAGQGTATAGYGATFTTNDVIGVAFDDDNGTITFYKNGVSQGQAYSGISTTTAWLPVIQIYRSTGTTQSAWINFGQRPFAYTAPSGFKALCTTNLPTPTIQKPSKYMDVVTYTGNGSTQTISGLGFSPDFVWIKARSSAFHHGLFDTVRGATKALYSSLANAEATEADSLTAFNSDGFSLGADTAGFVNRNSVTHVAWAWDEAPIAGMDIVAASLSGTSPVTVNHSLGVAPKMIIGKIRSNTSNWYVNHSGLTNNVNYYVMLNSTAAQASSSNIWDGAPTSTSFVVGNPQNGWNGGTVGSANYVFYLFAEVEGFSKFGSYTGNGSADGPFVWCGFRPRFFMAKRTDSTEDWFIVDTARDAYNQGQYYLAPNLSNAETTMNYDIISNGLKFRGFGSPNNTSGGTYIFAAFAESPFKYARAR